MHIISLNVSATPNNLNIKILELDTDLPPGSHDVELHINDQPFLKGTLSIAMSGESDFIAFYEKPPRASKKPEDWSTRCLKGFNQGKDGTVIKKIELEVKELVALLTFKKPIKTIRVNNAKPANYTVQKVQFEVAAGKLSQVLVTFKK